MTYEVVATIPVPLRPHHIRTSRDGRYVYVSQYATNGFAIIDTATDRVVQQVKAVDSASALTHSMWISRDRSTIWAANEVANQVTELDGTTGAIRWALPVGQRPSEVLVTPDNRVAYVTVRTTENKVKRIDVAARAVTAEVTSAGTARHDPADTRPQDARGRAPRDARAAERDRRRDDDDREDDRPPRHDRRPQLDLGQRPLFVRLVRERPRPGRRSRRPSLEHGRVDVGVRRRRPPARDLLRRPGGVRRARRCHLAGNGAGLVGAHVVTSCLVLDSGCGLLPRQTARCRRAGAVSPRRRACNFSADKAAQGVRQRGSPPRASSSFAQKRSRPTSSATRGRALAR